MRALEGRASSAITTVAQDRRDLTLSDKLTSGRGCPMSEAFQPDLDFEATRAAVETGEALIVDLDAYEGPLDVLLALARAQKVDLLQISISKLADQYLAF